MGGRGEEETANMKGRRNIQSKSTAKSTRTWRQSAREESCTAQSAPLTPIPFRSSVTSLRIGSSAVAVHSPGLRFISAQQWVHALQQGTPAQASLSRTLLLIAIHSAINHSLNSLYFQSLRIALMSPIVCHAFSLSFFH